MQAEQPTVVIPRPSRLKRAKDVWARTRRHPPTVVGAVIVVFFLLMAVFGPLVAPYTYSQQVGADRLQGPSWTHLFGTDQFGRDVLSRILWGARDIFVVAGFGTLLAVLAGSVLGLLSGYAGRWIDEGVMRVLDVLLALPPLLLAMVLLGSVGPSRLNIIFVVGVLYIPMVARVVRSVVLDIKTREFVEAAKLRGEHGSYIMSREILPNALPALAVEGSMRFSYAIFLVASLGFLGLGVQPPAPDWGLMVNEARSWFDQAPWMLFFPAGAIALLIVGVGFLSDGMRRILWPTGVSE
jgi:peptide/nickel transport system permease protein